MNSPLKVLFTLAPVRSEAAQDIQLRPNFCFFMFHQVASADFVPPETNDPEQEGDSQMERFGQFFDFTELELWTSWW